MAVPRSILAAVDFGEASVRAIAVGGLIAEHCHAKSFRLVHSESIEAPVYFTSEQLERLERERHALYRQAEEFLARFGRQHTTVPFSVHVNTLPPVDAILHESTASDLVVMGTHGRRGPKRWWLGSVAERVLRQIATPLLIVRAVTDHTDASLFERALVYAPAPLTGTTTFQLANDLGTCLGGEVVDRRRESPKDAIERTDATVLIVSVPQLRPATWLSEVGEPLVRLSPVPVLFVPEVEGLSA